MKLRCAKPVKSPFLLPRNAFLFFFSRINKSCVEVAIPLQLHVVPGDVTDAYLDISEVPEYVPVYSSLARR